MGRIEKLATKYLELLTKEELLKEFEEAPYLIRIFINDTNCHLYVKDILKMDYTYFCYVYNFCTRADLLYVLSKYRNNKKEFKNIVRIIFKLDTETITSEDVFNIIVDSDYTDLFVGVSQEYFDELNCRLFDYDVCKSFIEKGLCEYQGPKVLSKISLRLDLLFKENSDYLIDFLNTFPETIESMSYTDDLITFEFVVKYIKHYLTYNEFSFRTKLITEMVYELITQGDLRIFSVYPWLDKYHIDFIYAYSYAVKAYKPFEKSEISKIVKLLLDHKLITSYNDVKNYMSIINYWWIK